MTDRLKIVTALGAFTVEYDVAQAQEDNEAKYRICRPNGDEYDSGFVELTIGDDIPVIVARESVAALTEEDVGVLGLIVGEHRLASFLSRFDELEIWHSSEL